MIDTDIASQIWRASVFAHHANDTEGKVRLLDAWHDECEAELSRLIGWGYDLHPLAGGYFDG